MAAAAALRPDEEKLYEGQPRGFPLEGFQVEDVMLPEDDDMGIPSEDELDDEEEIESESGFGSVIGALGAVPRGEGRRRALGPRRPRAVVFRCACAASRRCCRPARAWQALFR